MHEVGIAHGIIKIIQQETAKHGMSKVRRVHVRIGELSNLVPDALSFAFETISPGTIAEGAELKIEIVPPKGRCEKCDIEFPVDGIMFFCPQCNAIGSEIVAGKELEIAEIEGE